jgi:hypothetical protein
MSEPQIAKNQHYIPQFYLRKFQNIENKVQILSCEHNKLFSPRSPRSICSEEFYYSAETGVSDKVSQEVENMFKNLESVLAQKIPAIEENLLNGKQIDEGEKWTLGFLMSMIWIRGPVMREQTRGMVESITQQMMSFTFRMPDDRIKGFFDGFDKHTGRTTTPKMREKIKESFLNKDYKLNINNVVHISMFANIHNFANLFAAQDWFVYISKAKLGFITSDNPVAEVFPEMKGFYGASFFDREHYFTLSPEIIIHCKYPNKNNSKGLRRKTYFESNNEKILSLNLIIASYALKFIYAKEKESLENVLKIVEFHKSQQYKSLVNNLAK